MPVYCQHMNGADCIEIISAALMLALDWSCSGAAVYLDVSNSTSTQIYIPHLPGGSQSSLGARGQCAGGCELQRCTARTGSSSSTAATAAGAVQCLDLTAAMLVVSAPSM